MMETFEQEDMATDLIPTSQPQILEETHTSYDMAHSKLGEFCPWGELRHMVGGRAKVPGN